MFHECRHIKTNGLRCHGAALRGKPYCYFHMNLRRMNSPKHSESQPLQLPLIEDTASVLLAVNQVTHYLNSPHADCRRAGLMLYSLQIAAQLTNRKEHTQPNEFVHDVHNVSGEAVDFSEALDNGAEILAPDKTVCEPPNDCRNCPKQNSCRNYEEPEDEEEEDNESSEENDAEESEENDEGEEEAEEKSEDDAGSGNKRKIKYDPDYDPNEYLTDDEIDRRFLRALKRRRLEREARNATQT